MIRKFLPALAACLFAATLTAAAQTSNHASKETNVTPVAVEHQRAPSGGVPLDTPPLRANAVNPSASSEEEAADLPNDAAHQGIKVHGHWVINVRNPDGTLVQHREFENSLADNGFNFTRILTGAATPGEFYIRLQSNASVGYICGYQLCTVEQYSNGAFASYFSGQCTQYPASCASGLLVTPLSTVSGGVTTYTVQLSGQITAAQAGGFFGVATALVNCTTTTQTLSNVAPSSCATQTNLPANSGVSTPAGNGIASFTSTGISTVNVAAGQTVQITVVLSFS